MSPALLLAVATTVTDARAGGDDSFDPGPNRCEAVFIGPVEGANIKGSYEASGAGRDGRSAHDNAVTRLTDAVIASAMAQAIHGSGNIYGATLAAQLPHMPRAVEENVRVVCHRDSDLSESQFCFVSFDDKRCWRDGRLDIQEKAAWKSFEKGLDEMCKNVEKTLKKDGAEDGLRATCAASCRRRAKVSCFPQ